VLKKITRLEYIEALESGNYKKTTGILHEKIDGDSCFCGLGVAYALKGYVPTDIEFPMDYEDTGYFGGFEVPGYVKFSGSNIHGWLTPELQEDLEMSSKQVGDIIQMNDDGVDFKEIAHYLRQEWKL
jgi:hypothetical protein